MAIVVTNTAIFSLGNKTGVMLKVKGDGSITEIETNLSNLSAVILGPNIDDTAAIVDTILSTTDGSKFTTAVQATPTAIASGKYRTFLCIGSA